MKQGGKIHALSLSTVSRHFNMESILLPSKIQFNKGENANEAVLELEPCYHGYGVTIGNALRRVLLSSLPGAAITSVKFDGTTHEFSAIPNVTEDVLEIILNLKQVRMRVFSDEPVKLTLEMTGEGEVTAGDIQKNADVEVVNPKQHIATLTDKKANFKMELIVERGRGYLVTEEREKSKMELGMIAIDAIFTPVKNVAINVENVRVGQITNFDKLLLTVETDGTITPEEAVTESAKILINHLNLLVGEVAVEADKKAKKSKKKSADESEEEAAE
jgi:DNA-directed RNA polymerase subunit alpha